VVLVILGIILLSGILLEGIKITSYTSFQEMAEDYGGLDTQEETRELMALEAYWVDAFGVVSPRVEGPFDTDLLQEGEELHDMSCADCHSRPHWAFMGYGLAMATSPLALSLDRAGVKSVLWYIHFLSCFIGLAMVPFSKFFHIIATPVYLLVNAVMHEASLPANVATKRAIELDACTRCGECTIRCSVAVTYRKIPNPCILPSEKLVSLKQLVSGKKVGAGKLAMLQEGNHICTDCHRCTDVCPVGIDLQAQWHSLELELVHREYPGLEIWARESIRKLFNVRAISGQDIVLQTPGGEISEDGLDMPHAQTFSVCYGCQTCTNVCPVVGAYEDPQTQVDLLPHQIMHTLALNRKDMALGSRMLWDCVTCYLCQEECPQGVCITDVLYNLKNLAFHHLKE
jgi:heterodisulfide reductase subunit C